MPSTAPPPHQLAQLAPPHPGFSAIGAPQLQIEPTLHSGSPVTGASPPRRPVLKSIVVGPRIQLEETSATCAASPADGTSQKRVCFASPLVAPAKKSYYSTGKSSTRSYLRAAAATPAAGASATEHLHHQAAAHPIDGAFPSRGGSLRVDSGARRQAERAHSCAPATSSSAEEEAGWSRVRPKHWWRLPEYKDPASLRLPTTKATSTRSLHNEELLRRMQGKCFRCKV